jgi:hypothetical protein
MKLQMRKPLHPVSYLTEAFQKHFAYTYGPYVLKNDGRTPLELHKEIRQRTTYIKYDSSEEEEYTLTDQALDESKRFIQHLSVLVKKFYQPVVSHQVIKTCI